MTFLVGVCFGVGCCFIIHLLLTGRDALYERFSIPSSALDPDAICQRYACAIRRPVVRLRIPHLANFDDIQQAAPHLDVVRDIQVFIDGYGLIVCKDMEEANRIYENIRGKYSSSHSSRGIYIEAILFNHSGRLIKHNG